MSHKDGTKCAFLRIWRLSVSFHNVDLGKTFAPIGFNDYLKNVRGIAISMFGWTSTLKYWVKTVKYSDGVTVDCPMPSLVSYRVDLFSRYQPK
jgi:hypothetical protein